MIVKIFIGPINYDVYTLYQKDEEEYIIGVEQGALEIIKNDLTMDLALGDFDSISESEYKRIQEHALKIQAFKKRKNYTDSYLAIKAALKLDPEEILVYGGVGGRVDHTFANLMLLKLGPVTLINDTHVMYCLNAGDYKINNTHDYISFFALEDVKKLSLKHFSFELDDYTLNTDDPLCISNQGSGHLSFSEGLLLVIHSSDKYRKNTDL